MLKHFLAIRSAFVMMCALFVVVAAAQERPAKHNPAYDPKLASANSFSSVNTGVIIKIQSAAIASDGTITANFTLTDAAGAGLDVNGVYTAGAESLAFVAATIPAGQTQYTAYTTTVDAATSNNNPSQVQASTDKGGTFTLVNASTGAYTYTFGTKAPKGFDVTATHTIGAQASRDLSAFGYPSAFTSDTTYNFVPNGSKVTVVRDVVNEGACNQCHDPINAHGSPGPRTEISYCVLCHTPQSTNPDSLNTVDLKVFIHKVHMGSSLPSVKAGTPYYVQHRGSRVDFSTVVFPQDVRNCTTCHVQGATAPTQAANFMTKPSRAACGSCHDDVNFATGQNHAAGFQPDDTQCANCHAASMHAEFDSSIPGAHTVPSNSSALPGVVMKITGVASGGPGTSPVVSFQVKDKSGNPVDVTKLTSFRVVLGGNNVDYGVAPGMRVSETPTASSLTAGANGAYSYTMTNKIPATATGSYTVSLESYNNVTLLAGTTQQTTATDMAVPVEYYFSVDKSAVAPRRTVVATTQCASCHQNLGFVHSGARGNTQECVMCHNPTLTDGTSKQSVNYAVQIHSIHRGSNLANPYVLGTTNYQSVRFPGDLRDCSTCHVNNSYQVDKVGAVAAVASPGGFTPTTMPISAACQGCHDDKATASHALSNTSALGEACVTCHGIGAQFAVDTVHQRTQKRNQQ
jgi:OmcA/MtrC family decaheme c-type cytochrome